MLSGVSARRSTASLLLPALRSHEPELNSPSPCSPNPATLRGTACATETLGWRSPHALAPPAPPIPLPPTSVRRSSAFPPPPIAVSLVPAEQPHAPKCPRIPQVDTSRCAHFGHHPHLHILRPDGLRMTLTLYPQTRQQLPAFDSQGYFAGLPSDRAVALRPI